MKQCKSIFTELVLFILSLSLPLTVITLKTLCGCKCKDECAPLVLNPVRLCHMVNRPNSHTSVTDSSGPVSHTAITTGTNDTCASAAATCQNVCRGKLSHT